MTRLPRLVFAALDVLYQLLGFGRPTPTAHSSWGAIKRLCR